MKLEDLCGGMWDSDIRECLMKFEILKQKADKLAEDKKNQLYPELDAIREKRAALWEKYKQTRRSETTGAEMKTALIEMQEALDKSFNRFHE